MEKIFKVDNHIAMGLSGLVADGSKNNKNQQYSKFKIS